MNPLASTAVTLAKNLRAEPSADRASGNVAPHAGFAGLLGEQQQRFSSKEGSSPAYDGSAFEVAPARRDASRPAVSSKAPGAAAPPAAPETGRALEAKMAAKASLDRAQARAPQPTPAQGSKAAKAAEADADASPGRIEGHAQDPGETVGEAPPTRATGPTEPSDGVEAEPASADTQTLIDWMARWVAPEATGSIGLPSASRGAAIEGGADDTAGTAAQAGASGSARAVASEAGEPLAAEALKALDEEGRQGPARLDAPAPSNTANASLSALAGMTATGQPVVASAPAVAVQVATPVTSADFSQALAAQLATLAQDGVHEAQLQLNPADMGPISVQIVLDGSQAQIDFAATHARTREALEAAWPALAASLHSAGLTLAGGGVFEQRPGPRDGDGAQPGVGRMRDRFKGEGEGDGAEPLARTVRVDAQRGLLDLYA